VSAPASGGDAPGSAGDAAAGEAPAGGRAYVESVDVMLLESFPLQVRVGVAGQLSDPCTALGEPRVSRDGTTFRVALPTTREPGRVCAQVLVPFETTVRLDVQGLPKGTYTVDVEGTTASFTFERDNELRR
jgi:inhibitor of cysteine peptidase